VSSYPTPATRSCTKARGKLLGDLDQDPLRAIVESKRKLNGMPVVAGASFGHTTPQFTFPIGGYGCLRAGDAAVRLSIEVH
jgi:muramoyltetrapeptide carboxypeptidase